MTQAEPLFINCVFHITGIFPLRILLTPGADKKNAQELLKEHLSVGALIVTEYLTAGLKQEAYSRSSC